MMRAGLKSDICGGAVRCLARFFERLRFGMRPPTQGRHTAPDDLLPVPVVSDDQATHGRIGSGQAQMPA